MSRPFRGTVSYSTSSSLPLARLSSRWKSGLLSASLYHLFDRVNVLGDATSGHTGCVNALSWAKNGEILISGGDDTTVRLWRIDPTDTSVEYPFVCEAVIHTGHHANIFNAQMLPSSTRIVTVAGDSQVRISDVGSSAERSQFVRETEYTSQQANVRILRCHAGRVKRIVTEESPDLFLTVGEDGSVRQHDLRVPHECHSGSCPAPLINVGHELTTLAMSPLSPYHLVTAGESAYGYLFDRRHAGRIIQEEWGVPLDPHNITTCVRRFGKGTAGQGERPGYEHITGARMASTNGHEVLLCQCIHYVRASLARTFTAYSGDAVYLYSTNDDPQSGSRTPPSVLTPNRVADAADPQDAQLTDSSQPDISTERDQLMDEDIERMLLDETEWTEDAELGGNHDELVDDEDEEDDAYIPFEPFAPTYSHVLVVHPRVKLSGICNVETVKDVNFLGPSCDFVASGSDDGNIFIWDKTTGRIHDILEGDSSVVNVIEGHPYLPLVAVSGIDTTVKLFAPARGPSAFSRLTNLEAIVRRNSEALSRRSDLTGRFMQYALARRLARAESGIEGTSGTPCTYQ